MSITMSSLFCCVELLRIGATICSCFKNRIQSQKRMGVHAPEHEEEKDAEDSLIQNDRDIVGLHDDVLGIIPKLPGALRDVVVGHVQDLLRLVVSLWAWLCHRHRLRETIADQHH